MTISDLTNKPIGILGFGQEGQAIAEYLCEHGFKPTVYDSKSIEQWAGTALAFAKHLDLEIITGTDYLDKALANEKVIFRSPGVKITEEFAKATIDKQIIVTSQAVWFFQNSQARIIGVTGTKGKGTTASLLAEILQKARDNSNLKGNVYLTGNIGKVQPLEFLDKLYTHDLVVYELSSFQLQDLKQSPWMGICLMVTEDHLDYHSDLEEYYSAKRAISAFQDSDDVSIYNIDYPASIKIGSQGAGKKFTVSSIQVPDRGAFIEGESIRLIGDETVVINTSGRLLRGKHNMENIAAAALAAFEIGVPAGIIQSAITEFKGLKHRLQFVGTIAGANFYNDSISSIPDTAIAALQSFTEPIILLLGGASKNLNYDALLKTLQTQENLKAIITIGETGRELFPLIKNSKFKGQLVGPFENFSEAFMEAKSLAVAGDVVLLSPAATSFDMFKNYAERGDTFIKLVEENSNV